MSLSALSWRSRVAPAGRDDDLDLRRWDEGLPGMTSPETRRASWLKSHMNSRPVDCSCVLAVLRVDGGTRPEERHLVRRDERHPLHQFQDLGRVVSASRIDALAPQHREAAFDDARAVK